MSPHLLHNDVHLVECADTFVFLDLRRNRYICLPPSQAPVFKEACFASGQASLGTARALDSLHAKGLLTYDKRHGRPIGVTALSLPPPRAEVLPDSGTARFTHSTLAKLLASYAAAIPLFLVLRHDPRSLVHRVKQLKSDVRIGDVSDLESAAVACSETFHALAPFFVSSRDNCLMQGFILAYFLAKSGHPFDWVFGVRMAPFKAHCWIQSGSVVLDDSIDHILQFTPIMIV